MIAEILARILLVVGYIVYALRPESPGWGREQDLQPWATAMLVYMGVSVVVLALAVTPINLLGYFHARGAALRQGRDQMSAVRTRFQRDEVDRTINGLAAAIGFLCVGAGSVGALVVLALGRPAVVALHVAFGAFVAAALVGCGVKLYCYEDRRRRGF